MVRLLEENLPTVEPGEEWQAQDGNFYILHPDRFTLIDSEGRYFSPMTLRESTKEVVDMAYKYAIFEGDEAEMVWELD